MGGLTLGPLLVLAELGLGFRVGYSKDSGLRLDNFLRSKLILQSDWPTIIVFQYNLGRIFDIL